MKQLTLITLSIAFLSLSCKKKWDAPNPRKVRYEVTGNFTGKMLIIYNDNINGNTVINDVPLPWSKEVTYGANVAAIGISGNASTAGAPGQTATVKIYAGDKLVKQNMATAGSLGELGLPTLVHAF